MEASEQLWKAVQRVTECADLEMLAVAQWSPSVNGRSQLLVWLMEATLFARQKWEIGEMLTTSICFTRFHLDYRD